jgi:hypothetical protein
LRSVRLFFYSDGKQYQAPAAFHVQVEKGSGWQDAPHQHASPTAPIGNGENVVTLDGAPVSRLRVLLTPHRGAAVSLVEVKAY